ncbi:phosphoglycerate kinase [Candidatus Uhrbacteria bacterium]|nr:phosphoglycerate kinase [Candidatus Uhrbacteria bacterium]
MFKTIQSCRNLKGQRVLLRVDFNVLDTQGRIESDFRLKAAIPSIKFLVSKGARVILTSHAGRPHGKDDPKYSLNSIGHRLSGLLGKPVKFAPDCVGPKVKKMISGLKPGQILLLENLRFYKAEENNDSKFAGELAGLADIYVNDAFGVCHRANASVTAITKKIPSYAGLLLQKEIKFFEHLRTSPKKPFLLVIGGAKAADKLAVIKNLINQVDRVLVGGAVSNTFLKATGRKIGGSLYEPDMVKQAGQIYKKYGNKISLPIDVMLATRPSGHQKGGRLATIYKIKSDDAILDIGPKTQARYAKYLASAKTIFWAGPMGDFEVKNFAQGTLTIAQTLGKSKANTVVGGGETISAIENLGLLKKISHVSTGGGAALEFLAGWPMPGLKSLGY